MFGNFIVKLNTKPDDEDMPKNWYLWNLLPYSHYNHFKSELSLYQVWNKNGEIIKTIKLQ